MRTGSCLPLLAILLEVVSEIRHQNSFLLPNYVLLKKMHMDRQRSEEAFLQYATYTQSIHLVSKGYTCTHGGTIPS